MGSSRVALTMERALDYQPALGITGSSLLLWAESLLRKLDGRFPVFCFRSIGAVESMITFLYFNGSVTC